jgi:hypothetical protein
LLTESGNIMGARGEIREGMIDTKAPFTVEVNGRGSRLRADADLTVRDLGTKIEMHWFRLSRLASDTEEMQGRFDRWASSPSVADGLQFGYHDVASLRVTPQKFGWLLPIGSDYVMASSRRSRGK